MVTAIYRQQHRALLEMAAQMPSAMEDLDESKVRALLFKLTGALRSHLRLEEERLYPVLLVHPAQEARDAARRFQREMGGLLDAYTAFHTKWSQAGAVHGNPAVFLHEWAATIQALGLRLDREDHELYTLADRLGSAVA